ncbi:hypothetical protein E7T06_07710 [Deinococcus sp. Arct2-2]|uniref:PKD domain-containing protein n=1 Tax=Deinococcus sp. Arct2-2 TaxID=2568653 RepID=UPI0010A37946|nr:PKD domain-containing protein [Deinococcus sp. Arct2-2]THF70349.1 hypothetical protein E7T06_07710 [Deinococcus sp. Arct2-2]
MKTYAALVLLSLTLAACSQQATPATQGTRSVVGTTGQGQAFANTQAAQEAQITAELKALGLDGSVSAQAVTPQVYLNVLPVPSSDDSVRAYVKSTFASPVTCSVTWGDGSASTSVASPTVGRIETKDHAYATFGTYTITVTCRNGESVVGTQSMTVQAGKKATGVTLNFDAPVAPNPPGYNLYATYQEQGFTFSADTTGYDALVLFSAAGFGGYNLGPTQALNPNYGGDRLYLSASDSAPFTLKSFDFRPLNGSNLSTTLVGLKQDGSTLTLPLNTTTSTNQTVTLDSTWTNLSKVTFNAGNTYILIDNVNVSK